MEAVASVMGLRGLARGLVLAAAVALGCASCDSCSRGIRHPPPEPESEFVAWRSPEGLPMLGLRDKIPKERQVGCDVCPFWCTQFDLGPVPMDDLLFMYARVARHYFLDPKGHEGDAWPSLERMGCIAAQMGPAGHARFLELLDHEDVAVRYTAAVHAVGLGMGEERGLAVLRAIAAGASSLHLNAEIQLLEHEAGNQLELE